MFRLLKIFIFVFLFTGCASQSHLNREADEEVDNSPDTLRFYPDAALNYVTSGLIKQDQGNHIGAIHEFNKALLHDSSSVRLYLLIAESHRYLGEDDIAELTLEKGIKNTNYSPELLHYLGELQFHNQDFENALQTYLMIIKIYPDDEEAWHNLAALHIRDGDLEEAINCYQKMVDLGSKDLDMMARLATLLTHTGKQLEAINVYNEISKLRPDDHLIPFQKGGIYLELGDSLRADTAFARAVELAPQVPRYWAIRIRLALIMNDWDKTVSILDSSLATIPGNTELLNLGAMVYSSKDSLYKAESYLVRSIESDSLYLESYINLGFLYHEQKRYKEADDIYAKGLGISPDDGGLLNNYAYLLAESGDPERYSEALVMVDKALEVDGDRTSYLDTKGWLLYLLGQYDEAVELLNLAASREDASSEIFDHLGDLYFSINQLETAKVWWFRALESGGDEALIRPKLEK